MMRRVIGKVWAAAIAAVVFTSLWCGVAPALNAGPADGEPTVWRVRVPLPLSASASERIQAMIRRRLQEPEADFTLDGGAGNAVRRTTFLIELVADSEAAESEWGKTASGVACDLADFLTGPELAGARTVCYVRIPRLSGHALLVAMAADSLLARSDVEFCGLPASVSGAELNAATRETYREVASRRARIPEAVAWRFVDPGAELLELQTDVGTQFVLSRDMAEFEKTHRVDSEKKFAVAGEDFRFSAAQARRYGWVERLADQENDLYELLGTPQIMPLGEVPDQILKFRIEGAIPDNLADRIRRLVGPQLTNRRNVGKNVDPNAADSGGYSILMLDIESDGGNLAESLTTADWLLGLDSTKFWTVVRVRGPVRSDAILIVAACRQIVLAPEASFGGNGLEAFTTPEARRQVNDFLEQRLKSELGRDPSLLAAVIFPNQKLGIYRNRKTGVQRCFTDEMFEQRDDQGDWLQDRNFAPDVGKLTVEMSGKQLMDAGLPAQMVESELAVHQLLGGEAVPVVELRHNAVTRLVEFLASPWVTWTCLTLAFLALFVEIFVLPGIGIGGFLSLVFFGIFFWGKILGGTGSMLEVVLFVIGVICILLELFVLPGFGVFGIGGFVLVIGAIVLAMQGFFIPQTESDWNVLEGTLWGIVGALGVSLVGLFVLNWLLPRIFTPPSPDDPLRKVSRKRGFRGRAGGDTGYEGDGIGVEDGNDDGTDEGEGHDPFETMLAGGTAGGRRGGVSDLPRPGDIGIVVTPLVPSGRIEIRGQFHDVVSAGVFVEVGHYVRVIQVRGNLTIVEPEAT